MRPGFGFRELVTNVAASGLTGPADIPDPPEPDRPRGARARLRRVSETVTGTARALPRVLRLAWQAGPWLTIGLLVTTTTSGLLPAANAYVAKLLVDAVVEAIRIRTDHLPDRTVLYGVEFTSIGKMVALAAVQLASYTLIAFLTAIGNICRGLLQDKVRLAIRVQIMEHASRLDLAFFEGSSSYDLLRQAREEAAMRPVTMVSGAFGLVQTAITFASMVALLAAVSPILAIVALLAPVPAFISEFRYGVRGFFLSQMFSPINRRMEYLSSLVTTDEYAKEVKLFGLGGYFVNRYRMLGQAYYERQRRLVTARNIRGAAWSLISTLAGSGTYLYIAVQAVAGRLSLGDLTLYTSAATSVQSSVQSLFSGFATMHESNLYLDNLYTLLKTGSTVTRPANPRPLPSPLTGRIEFRNVSFCYPGASDRSLDDVSFVVHPGQTIAVVGRNGAGKSTLIKLLCRLYDPSAGQILLDGVDIREFDPDELRTRISAMFQDFVTYQATAAENIGLGDLDAIGDRPRVAESARKGGAAPLLEGLADGYDTPLGRWFDQGVNLSGGEWQKIALSRAFMRDAPLLVLDEPTSALDARAEHELFARLRELARGRTTLYISHRFSTVRQADRILFLSEGRLVEHGTHEELMAADGGYAELFRLQAAAYVDDGSTAPASVGSADRPAADRPAPAAAGKANGRPDPFRAGRMPDRLPPAAPR